ncbi:MAG: hypothetical protein HQL56_01170 [Magnetococcales bacterium]|nr:hypothetical protein [Magnetococcales bacterium]
MGTANQAKIQYEAGRTKTAYEKMTDSGDRTTLTPSAQVLSGKEGYAPTVRPNGIVTGQNLVKPAASGENDKVDVAAFTANSAGTLFTVAADTDVAITRPAGALAKVNSVTMNSSGAVAVVVGTDGASATFSEVRAAAGGPPLIPADSVEIAQIRVASSAGATIALSEVFQVIGQHSEMANFPTYQLDNIGQGLSATASAQTTAHLKFDSALPLSHTGPATKGVYIEYYEPVFADLPRSAEFVPADTSHSNSQQNFYGGTVTSTTESLTQGSFQVLLDNGVNDGILLEANSTCTVKFYPDKNRSPFILMQGKLGVQRTFPTSGGQIQANCTVSSEKAAASFNG